jgi:hypothetical protein
MQRRLVDSESATWTMVSADGEDTALLRSNRSARVGAGTRAGVCRKDSLLPSPITIMRSGYKAINLGVWGRAPRRYLRPLGHMSRCVS